VISLLVKSPYSKAEKKSIEWRRRADDALFSSGLESGCWCSLNGSRCKAKKDFSRCARNDKLNNLSSRNEVRDLEQTESLPESGLIFTGGLNK
jgi:hypothetical protein